jgi:hypothetical protein
MIIYVIIGAGHQEIDHEKMFPDILWASDYNPR